MTLISGSEWPICNPGPVTRVRFSSAVSYKPRNDNGYICREEEREDRCFFMYPIYVPSQVCCFTEGAQYSHSENWFLYNLKLGTQTWRYWTLWFIFKTLTGVFLMFKKMRDFPPCELCIYPKLTPAIFIWYFDLNTLYIPP